MYYLFVKHGANCHIDYMKRKFK